MPFQQDTADHIVDLVCTEWQRILATKETAL